MPPSQMLSIKSISSSPTHVKSSSSDEASFPQSLLPSNQEVALQQPEEDWIPVGDYTETAISLLEPGPGRVTFSGRIVNFINVPSTSKMPLAAKGCIKMILKDDTGALTIRLWYRNNFQKLRLGHLVTVWTTHVSFGGPGKDSVGSAPLLVSIFPEGDRSCCFQVYETSDTGTLCKNPLGYRPDKSLSGLVTLKNCIERVNEMEGVKILVCVKSIGARKTVSSKNGGMIELVNINVFDDTADAFLTLWGAALSSVDVWIPSHTVLLITDPQLKANRLHTLSCSSDTHIDIDSCMRDAEWLRNYAQRISKREHTNLTCPEGVFDVEAALSFPLRILYRLSDIDEFVRSAPNETFTGYLSVVIFEMHVTTLHLRNMLLCTECCGVPIYTNSTVSNCKQCGQEVPLRLNPRMVGTIVDETGMMAPGMLIWTQTAWEQLLGRTPQELVESSAELLRYLDRRLGFLRVTLVFGWAGGEDVTGGRLCILRVLM